MFEEPWSYGVALVRDGVAVDSFAGRDGPTRLDRLPPGAYRLSGSPEQPDPDCHHDVEVPPSGATQARLRFGSCVLPGSEQFR